MKIVEISVDEGPTMRRFRARAREFQGYDFSELGRVWLNGA